MLRIGTRKSHNWHGKVDKTASCEGVPIIISGTPNTTFPWAQLGLHTDIYLKKKGTLTPLQQDIILLALIQKHAAIQIAVAACAHAISPDALAAYIARELKTAHSIDPENPHAVLSAREVSLLEAVVAAHHLNPASFKGSDSRAASALLQCHASIPNSAGRYLEALVDLIPEGHTSLAVMHPYILRVGRVCAGKFSSVVEGLRQSRSWREAHTETAWLARLLDEPDVGRGWPEVIEILRESFQDWRVWAGWSEADSQLAQVVQESRLPGPCAPGGGDKVAVKTSQKLERLVRTYIAAVGERKCLYVYLDACGLMRQYSAVLSGCVYTLVQHKDWLAAHAETKWFSILLDPSIQSSLEVLEVIKILCKDFTDWRAWAEWGESDSQIAHVLEEYRLPGFSDTAVASPSRKLDRLVKTCVASGPKKKSFIYQEACAMIRSFSTDLSEYVNSLKGRGRWLEAHAETHWLSVLLNPYFQSCSEFAEVVGLLSESFPEWGGWAAWNESDSQTAQALVPCYESDVTAAAQNLQILIEILMAGVPSSSILYCEIHRLAQNYSFDLSQILEDLAKEVKWYESWANCQWLSTLLRESAVLHPGHEEAMQVLNSWFPRWKIWALWRPDVQQLLGQEKLHAEHQYILHDLLALEGPDLDQGRHATMREALIAQNFSRPLLELCWGKTRLRVRGEVIGNVRDKFERLSNAVNTACARGTSEIKLLEHLCCNGRLIDDETLNILDAKNFIGDSLSSEDMLLVLRSQHAAGGLGSQMAAVMRILPLLSRSNGQALRHALSSRLVEVVSTSIREMQALLSIQIGDSKIPIEFQLHAVGLGVQAAQWLQPLLDASLGGLIGKWPPNEKFEAMNTLRADVVDSFSGISKRKINEYYSECFIESGRMDSSSRNIIEALIQLWHARPDSGRKFIALVIANGQGAGSDIVCECLRQLLAVPSRFVDELYQELRTCRNDPDGSCIRMARIFATTVLLHNERSTCWRRVIYNWIMDRGSTLLEYSLTHLPALTWFRWLSDLQMISRGIVLKEPLASRSLFRPALFQWAHRIYRYGSTISRLEHLIGSGPATQCILAGFDSQYSESILEIVELLESYFHDSEDGETLQPAVRATITLLDRADDGNAKQIALALSMLMYVTIDGSVAYLRILEVYQSASAMVASVLLVGWIRHAELSTVDGWALQALGKVLGIYLDTDDHPNLNGLDGAGYYIKSQVASLLDESENLASLRRSLMAIDRVATSKLLTELEIEDTSPLEDEVAFLPTELVDVIEIVGEDIVELHFPLKHSALQLTAMGTGTAQSLIVRLVVGNPSLPSGFCIHFDDELKDVTNTNHHSPWLVLDDLSSGGAFNCHGNVSRAKFQLGIILSHHILGDTKPLEDTYKLIKLRLETLSSNCIVCGTSLAISLRRSTVCQDPKCSTEFFLRADLRIQLYDLQKDPAVGDLLLSATQAAAKSGNMALLPECPCDQDDKTTDILSKLNDITVLQAADDMRWELGRLGKSCVPLFKWIFNHYRGFLVSASGQTRIPSMPGVHQFLLANAAPDLEIAFVAQMGSLPTRVVFHGTSLDRLYAILCQGLRVCSGNATLQRHGAVYGDGIYVAKEPGTAMGYAGRYIAPEVGHGWHSDTFSNVSVLLGCEASGNIPVEQQHGIHVVTNPNMLILRYVFLVPDGIRVPIANHIVPAMNSVFASLRSGGI